MSMLRNENAVLRGPGEPDRITDLQSVIPLKRHERVRVAQDFSDGGRTQQEFSKECDINEIMKKYKKNAVIEHVNRYEGRYGDFIGAPDFQTAQNMLIEAEEMFLSLPANVRREFDNDPAQFLAFAQDEKNLPKLREMGLAKPVEPKAATLDDVVSAVKESGGRPGGTPPAAKPVEQA